MSQAAARVFSGIQPTGHLHLGNYLGAIRNWVRLQDDYACLYCIVDLHAITVFQPPAELRAATREAAAVLLAAGVDPKRSIIFNQSQVSAHAELAWIFNCVTRIGWLNRMTQFKDKAGKDREKASSGLYVYPNLMAADILAYRATHVPVGEDQKQHLELARDIAQKFNNDYGVDYLPLVEPLILREGARVMSLRDGRVKMSKSDPSDMSRINLTDSADLIAQKIRKARTDADPIPETPAGLADRPEADNLVGIMAAFADTDKAAICAQYGGQGFAAFKAALTERAVAQLAPMAARINRLLADPASIDAVLRAGAARAAAIAQPILREIHEIVGFLRP
ncbi:MAG: tryptophan--tRNA ligase [Alphaproteobacteria bacterium]|nr:MAG: tryptophan--tRNA ligase [Alphaproteobacteria bacterium]